VKDIRRFVKNQASPEKSGLEKRQGEFEDLEAIWTAANQSPRPERPDLDRAWRRLESAMDQAPSRRRIGWLVPALAFVIALGFALWVFNPRSISYVTGPDQTLEVSLPDGSSANLNHASRLQIDPNFNSGNRKVYLEGEAFFDVVPGTSPFQIEAGHLLIQVLGTRFNVGCLEDRIEVEVIEGRVELSGRVVDQPLRVIVESGQRAVWPRGAEPRVASRRNSSEFPAWISGEWVFDAVSIADACRDLEQHFGVTIILSDPALGTERISGKLIGDQIEDVIQALTGMTGSSYRVEGDVYIIQ